MGLKFTIHANGVPWQKEYLGRFCDGLAAHGHRVIHSTKDEADYDAVNIVFANNSWRTTVQNCTRKKIPLVTVGRCFFGDRHDMVAIGWDGFNGDADFCLEESMPDDRWQKHGHCLPPGFSADGYILVCGEFRPMDKWYATMREILAGEDVRFRPHPFKGSDCPAGWQLAPQKGQDALYALFNDVRCLITYDSIAGCDGVLASVPTVVWGEAGMARPVAYHSWRDFITNHPITFDLHPWANRLAYCQWSHDEITSGEWWAHLEPGLEARVAAEPETKRDKFSLKRMAERQERAKKQISERQEQKLRLQKKRT